VVAWLEWGSEAFARAARERKPVLLTITAAWCRACHEMDRTTYGDAAVIARIRERFIPVRVDSDCRPDINDRYNLGGWPTTAFLTPDGELMTGGTFVPPDRMVGILDRVAARFDQDRELTTPAASEAARALSPAPQPAALGPDLVELTFSTFDEVYGGFGVEPKFPLSAPLHLALDLFVETREPRWREIVERTLDAMATGGLWDAEHGGFRRYATRRDWQLPHHEKLLETNADLLRVYAAAARVLGRDLDRDRVTAIAGFMTATLRDPGGGYHGSDAGAAMFADGNAVAARALLTAASLLEDDGLGQEALDSFERVLLACYRPGQGVAHCFDGRTALVRGLLADQIATIAALLDAYELTDSEPYKMMAEELGHFVVRDMTDSDDGGCFDRAAAADDLGLLRWRRKPFAGNAEAAQVFARLNAVTHEFDFAPLVVGALDAAGRLAGAQGPLAAHYILALRQVR
jgi:hypothetical protein